MINNPTNVNKTNNHLAPEIIGNPDPDLGHAQKCGEGIPTLPLVLDRQRKIHI